MTWATACRIGSRLPGVEPGTCYGTPALYVRRKLLARLKEDGSTVALRVDFSDRDVLLQLDPRAFYLTDHYRGYPWVLVRLPQVRPRLFEELLEQAWRGSAPKSLAAARSPSSAADGKGRLRKARRGLSAPRGGGSRR